MYFFQRLEMCLVIFPGKFNRQETDISLREKK